MFSPGGTILVTSPLPSPFTKGTPTLSLHNAHTGDFLGNLTGHSNTILGAEFANDALLYSWSLDGTVRAWDVRERKVLKIVLPVLSARLD
jgi:WD40 repeat protein